MPADLIVLLGFARSSVLTALVEDALRRRQPFLGSQSDERVSPFVQWLRTHHFEFLDRIDAALARESGSRIRA